MDSLVRFMHKLFNKITINIADSKSLIYQLAIRSCKTLRESITKERISEKRIVSAYLVIIFYFSFSFLKFVHFTDQYKN